MQYHKFHLPTKPYVECYYSWKGKVEVKILIGREKFNAGSFFAEYVNAC